MVALVDSAARLLHRNVLAPTVEVQWTDRRVAIIISRNISAQRTPGRSGTQSMRRIPTLTGQSTQDVVIAADEDEIHGVSVSGASGVCSATWQGLDSVAQLPQGQRPCGHGTWADAGLLVVKGAVWELKEEAVPD